MSIDNENTEFEVVINEQGQYGLWPGFHAVPAGWRTVDVRGNRQTCLAYINENWTDMRPQRLRDALAG